MLKIGEFASIAKVSIHLLRYYDKIDLLKPNHTDKQSGYRYYQANQLPRLNRIMALKELGFSLEQVASMLDDPISPDEIRGMLRLKRAQIEELLIEEQARLERIELRLKQIDDEGLFPEYNIEIKQIPVQHAAMLRNIPNIDREVKILFDKLYENIKHFLNKQSLPLVMFDRWDAETIDLGYMAVQSLDTLPASVKGNAVETVNLPPVAMMATSLYKGPRADLHIAYGQMVSWFEAHNYEYQFPARQLYIQPGHDEKDAQNIVELQIPLG